MDQSTGHQRVAPLADVGAALDVAMKWNPVFATPSEKRTILLEAARLAHQFEGFFLNLLAAGDIEDIGEVDGSASTAVWLAHHTRTDRPVAHTTVRLARALEGPRAETGAALARGEVSLQQADAIVWSLDRLPDDLDPELVTAGEKHLIAEAAHHDPKTLRILGRKLLEVLAPDLAEERLRRQVEADEAAAYARSRLTLHPNNDGTTTGRFTLPDLHADMLTAALDALTAPRKQQTPATDNTSEEYTPAAEWPQDAATRRGKAFTTLLEHLPVDTLGDHGSTTATVVVTMTLDDLTEKLQQPGALGIAGLDDDTPISAATARKLACQAGIIPMVLGGPSVIADRGRTRRLFTHQQRLSLNLRDRHCRAQACTIPAAWTEAHHLTPWAHGGNTDLTDGILLCGHHHRLIHAPDYTHHHDPPTHTVTFHRRT